jgi:hypothetical protein
MARKKKQASMTYGEWQQKNGKSMTYGEWQQQNKAKKAEQAKQRQQERVSKMTDLFRDSAAHEQNARYDGTAPSTYAAKMMLDSHSSTEAENERRAKVNAYLTNLKKDREAKQNTSSFSNWMAANKTKTEAGKTIGKKTTELEDLLQQAGKRPKTIREGTDQQTEKQRPTTVEDYRTFLGEKKELQKQGAFDNDKDSKWWSDEKLETGRKNVQDQIDVVDSQLDKLKAKQQNKENWYPRTAYSGWSNLYEEMRDGRIRNGRDLLDYTDDEKNIGNRARDYVDNVFQNQAEIEDSETGRQRARERAFNYVYGYSDENSGMYDLVTEGMSEREKAEFDSKLDNIISGMRNPYRNFDYDQEAYGLNSQRDKLSGDLSKWTGEQDRRSRIVELEAGAPDATGIADPEKKYITGGNNVMQFLVNSMTGTQGDDMDKAFWEIRNQQSQWNSMTTAEKIDMLNQLTGSTSHDGLAEPLQDTTKAFGQYYAFMTPEQVDTFERYYKTGNKESARAYLEALRPYLSMYANEYSKYVAEEAAKGDNGWAYGAMSIAMAPMNALVSGIGTVLAAAGNEEARSENSTWFRGQNIQNAIREGRKEAWGENASRLLGSWAKAPAEFLNGVFYSMADMAVATGIGGALSRTSEISQPLVQFVMSSEAASNTMTEQLERGIDPREAALYAVGSGTIEWLTEKYSIEQLLNPNVREMLGDKKQIAKFIAKNFVAEGSEEGASSVLEIGLDALLSAINGHESELEEKYNQLKGQIGEKNAFKTVLMDQLKQTGMEMLAGGVSGLLMASARVAENSLNQTSTGQQVRSAETSGSSGTDVIIDAALTLKEDAQSRILAEKMAEKREAGKMISDMELGRLVQNLQNDTNERIMKTAMTVVEDRAYELLGEENVQGNDQREKAQLIAKAVTDVDSLTKSERNQLIGDKAAFSVFKTFMTPNETSTETMGKVAEDTRTERQAQESVSELLGVKKKSTVDTSGVGEQMATQDEISQAEGSRAKGNEVILDGQFGKITGAIASADGKNNGLKFRVNVNGHTQAVTPSQIKATDFGTAAIIREAAVNPGFYTADYANTLLHAQENGNVKNVGTFLADATKLRIAAYTGQMMPITGIDRTTAIEIYNSSAKEHGANRKAQVTGTDAGGKVMIDGATYGTEAWTEKLNEIKNKNAKAQIETIAGLFAPHGIAVTFKTAEQMARDYENLTGEKEDGTKIYGEEGPEGISINIEGLDYALGENGKPEAKGSHNMLVTFGHEMTHWLQRRSMQGYNNLETFVFNEMANNGIDLNNRVTQVMERLGLNLEDAMSEIVADSCDQILANESVRDHIQETNQSLFKEIKSFVTDLVGRIKTAVMGMDESKSRDAMAMLNSANRLAKVWLGAYDEAISGAIRNTEGETGESTTRLSLLDNKDLRYNEQVNQFFSKKGMPSDRAFVLENSLQDAGITEKYIMMRQGVVTKALREESGSRSAHADTISEKDIRATNKNLRTAEALIDQKDGTQLVLKAREGQMPVAYAIHHNEYYGEKVAEIATLHGRENPLAYFEERMESGEYKRIFIRENGTLQQLPGTTIPSQAASLLERALTVPQNDQSGKTRMSMADLDSEYQAALKNGDTDAAARLVQEYAESAGYPVKVFHGTNRFGFTEIDTAKARDGISFFATDSLETADSYSGASGVRLISDSNKENKTGVYQFYANTDGFIEVDAGENLWTSIPWSSIVKATNGEAENWGEYIKGGLDGFINTRRLADIIARNTEYKGIKILALEDNGGTSGKTTIAPASVYIFFEPETQLKSADTVTYDNEGNVIPLSQRFDISKLDIRYSKAQMDNDYMQAVKDGDTGRQQEIIDEAAQQAGYKVKAYHGTGRADRVGTVFLPERATSGPMAYFTDNREIAENYARDKKDTSIAYDDEYGDYHERCRGKDKNGKSIPVGQIWNTLSYREKMKIRENAKHIAWDDAMENIIFDPEAQSGNGGFSEWTLRDYKGNAIDALVYAWLDAGDLYGQEEKFLDVLKLAGIEGVTWNNPDYREEKVYDTYLKILNPFKTSSMFTEKFVNGLLTWWEEQDQDMYIKDSMGADLWDKNSRTVEQWSEMAMENIKDGRSTVWTSIPDAVSDYLRSMGYDGIQDTGGKGGGIGHTVWIPFSSEQIKSAEPVTYDDNGKVIPPSERFNESRKDIRWSRSTGVDQKQQELSQAWQEARDEANEMREQVRNMKPEMDAWADRITEAQKAGKMDEILAEYKEWEKGYTELRDKLFAAEQKYKEANKAYDDYIEQRDVAAEQKAIKESGLSEPEYRRKQAVEYFGYTSDFREAGYLLPNGRMLNFSGEKGRHYGSRGEDHRGIGIIYASSKYQGGEAMMQFMRDGNIRVMAETPGVDLIASKEPTADQYAAIRNMVRRFAGKEYFNVDFTDDRGFNEDSIEYDGRVNPDRVVNDIKTFYRTGEAPQQSTVSQFHFSRVTSESMDVGSWMMGQTAGSVQTEAERQLLQDYRDLRISISLSIKRQLDYKEKIKRLEAREADLTPAERDDLIGLRNKLEIQQQKQADLENKLYKVTAADGWAGMMYHNNIVLNDFILGKTQDQVRESVEQMVDQVKAAEKIIAQQAKALRKMADSQAVRAVSSMINKKTLNYAVKSLKDMTNSAMGKTELESRLTEMALKRANGEDITEDARELATDMTNRMRGYQNDVLERMRGVTITIGPDQQKEMKGNGMTLASVREQLKGTGVKVKYGDFSSLDTDTGDGGDLRTLLPELPQDIGENSGDALFKFISWAQSMRDVDQGMKQQMVDLEDTIASVMALTSTIEVNMNSPEYRKQNQMAAQTKQMAEDLEQAGKTLTDETDLAGKRAVGMASVLQRDVREAIRYYNTIARMAAQEEKTKVKKNVIEQLKSQHTADLIKQQMKYEKMMKDDRKARGIAEDNLQIRNRVNTVASRIRKRLMEETDLKNIPEEAKPLARQVLKMLVQHDYVGYRHILFADKMKREQTMRALDSWEKRDGAFKDEDLDWLIVGSGADADWTTHDMVVDALIDIEQGLLEYRTAEGHGLVTLMDRKAALKKIDEAVTNIWNVIAARETANINYKRMLISELAMQARDDMANSRFKGEWTGKIGHGIGAVRSGVVYGNMTPEYFFKNLRNGTLSMLYDEYHRAENRNGLEVGKAKEALARIAEETGYGTWDQEKRHTFKLEKGGTVNLTLGEMMSLYATWQRELMNQIEANGPETSFHLEVGGFYTAQEEQAKLLGREKFTQKAHRLTAEDMARIRDAMTPEQLEYVERVVKYITEDIGALGNEASMRMFGIKKYNEKWYFPFEVWSGVKSKKSDQGAAGNTENRAAHASFTKRRKTNAGNALVIRDFTQTAVKHIGGMINYNTFAPAIEFMNRVMNYQIEEAGEGEDSSTRRNIRTLFGEIYGKDALTYLENFNQDLNGGATRIERTAYDRLLSTFKKSAVAGSLSVALQQPLSYIRASMMISPKYLAEAINPAYYKGSRAEMEKYSGVAVIKNMGKFDMNLGQSAQDYMSPDRKESTGKKVYAKVSNAMTALPGAMDTMTWTRMWTAVKLEQQAKHPEMDHRSTEFMETVAERFNDVMRKTQVYDSVLVKSKNMRSINPFMKALTSFMAEPTLTANVLADAVVNRNEKGGKLNLAKAGATFILGAIAQALVKGVISAGRSPDEKKTWDENVMYRFAFNFMNEINPMGLIPGYSDLIETLKKGELQDDAMSVVGKIMTAVKTSINAVSGQSKSGWYRDVEDSVGQLAQLFTNVPAKNMMRDARAMWNFFVDQPYADRANSMAVLKYQQTDQFRNADNILGVINTWLGEKGWQTNNSAYYGRIYEADKAGKQQKVSEMMEYLKLARGTKESTVNTAISGLIKQDDKLTEQQKLDWQKKYGLEKGSSYITDEYKKGNIDRKTAESMYRKENPKAEDKKVWETFDRIDYTNDGKLEDGQYYSSYLPLYDAIETGNQKEISNAVKKMLSYGYKKENIKKQLGEKYKAQYIAASVDERRRMVNKLTKAYKEIGVEAAEAQKIMQDWALNDKKKQSKKN